MVKSLNSAEDFETIVKEGNILIDFYADWCGPCKMLSPILETITEIDVLKVNVDTFNEIAVKFGVMSIPTLILMKNGQIVKKEIGFKTKDDILKMIA